jgi:hypothetical protein
MVRSALRAAISSAFCLAAALSRFSCTVPRSASWLTTPLQMPLVVEVPAADAGLPARSAPTKAAGSTSAVAARRRGDVNRAMEDVRADLSNPDMYVGLP